MTKLSRNKKIALSTIMILVSPAVFYAVMWLLGSMCPKTEFGSCEFGYGVQSYFITLFLSAAWGIAWVIMLVLTLRNKKSK